MRVNSSAISSGTIESARSLAAISSPINLADKVSTSGIGGCTPALRKKSVICSRIGICRAPKIQPRFVRAFHLPTFTERHPLIRLVLSATSDVASLERGEADISLGFVRPDLPGRIVRQVGNVDFALYSSLAISAASPETWRFIGFEGSLEDIPQQRWLTQFAAGRPFVLCSNDVATQMQAAKSGLGVALLPDFLKAEETGMVRLDGDAQPLKRPLWMSVHADIRRSPAVREVMECLGDILAA